MNANSSARALDTVSKKRTGRSKLYYRWYVPYLFLLPGLVLYLVWTVYPLFYQLYISFFNWRIIPGQVSQFIGLANYNQAIHDPVFWLTLRNTIGYTVITVAGQMVIGLAIAVMVNRVVIGKRTFRAIYYLPVVTSWVVVSFLFQDLFSPGSSGLVNYILFNILHVIPKPISWLGNGDTAWVAIDALGIWKGVGWAMVIFLAALQGIPVELYEAAAIDGAGEWKQLRHLTLPLIRRTTIFVLIALFSGGFQVFISVLLLTNGAPQHRTDVSLSYMFNQAFGNLNFGYGAALSYILAVIIVVFSFVQMRVLNRSSKDLEY